MYGQKDYLATQGINGKYRIDQIGCFLTSFCNLLGRYFGTQVGPVALNNYFVQRGVYIDVDDGIRDDLFWSAVTAFAPNVTVAATGAGGWPNSDVAIVCFRYKSRNTGAVINHFCLVADAENRVIIDSYDGLLKAPAAYESIYGQPTQWAIYQAPVARPTSPTASNDHPAVAPGEKLFLPAAAGYWRVYAPGGPWTVGKELGKLWPGNPAWAPGLTYDIIGNPAKNMYLINTQTYGQVAIYAGSDTIAQFVDSRPAAPAPAPVAEPAVAPPDPEPKPEPETPVVVDGLQSSNPPMTTVTPTAPAWHLTTPKVADWEATQDYQVVDLETGVAAAMLYKGQTVHSVAKLNKDGQEYVLTQKSVDKKVFNGVPTKYLQLKQDFTPKKDTDDDGILDLDDLKLDEFMADSARLAKDAVEKVKSNKTLRDFFVNLFAKFYRKK